MGVSSHLQLGNMKGLPKAGVMLNCNVNVIPQLSFWGKCQPLQGESDWAERVNVSLCCLRPKSQASIHTPTAHSWPLNPTLQKHIHTTYTLITQLLVTCALRGSLILYVFFVFFLYFKVRYSVMDSILKCFHSNV